jgi:predicted nucleotidyltransferase
MKCQYCGYEWEPRKPEPVSCPRCKRRFDFPRKGGGGDPLADAMAVERGFERMLYVMSIITPALESRGIKSVVVGGSAVEFYTRDWYATGDIDLAVTKGKRRGISRTLEELGFKTHGRMWVREDLNLYIETPGDVADLDSDRVTRVETDVGHAYVIGIEDIILDRVNAARHWKSESDREQAIRMVAMFENEIDWRYLQERARKEKVVEALGEIREAARNAGKRAK